MNYVFILVPILTLCAGGAGGYYLGRYTRGLVNEIRTLTEQGREEKPAPTVVMGAYSPPQEVSTATDERLVGLVEAKTPERLSWEQDEAIEREGRGFPPA